MAVVTVFVPMVGSSVLGSAYYSPWLAESVEDATAPGHRQGQACFETRELADEWVEWARQDVRYTHMRDELHVVKVDDARVARFSGGLAVVHLPADLPYRVAKDLANA